MNHSMDDSSEDESIEVRRSKRLAEKPAGIEGFYELAWPEILQHYKDVIQTNPDAEEDTRDQTTVTLLRVRTGELQGRLKDKVHGESDAYNQLWNALEKVAVDLATSATSWVGQEKGVTIQNFDTEIKGATVKCISWNKATGAWEDSHKASCFMCSAIAHTLGVSVELKDRAGYEDYGLPNILLQSPLHLRKLVGDKAYAEFEKLTSGQQSIALVGLGGALYKAHARKGTFIL